MVSLDRKNRHNRKERSAAKMVIFTEGDVTEPQYLSDWIKKFAVKNEINPIKAKMKFEIVASNDKSEPLKIVERLIDAKKPAKNSLDIFMRFLMKMIEVQVAKIKRISIKLLMKQKTIILKLFALIGLWNYGL